MVYGWNIWVDDLFQIFYGDVELKKNFIRSRFFFKMESQDLIKFSGCLISEMRILVKSGLEIWIL